MSDAGQSYAVLTGDIVKSSKLTAAQLESVRECVLAAIDQARGWRRGTVKGKAEFYRGDAWQVLVADVSQALRVALLIRASVIAQGIADTRVSIGLGTVDNLSRTRVSLSTGEAFVLSGHALDELSVATRLTIAASSRPVAPWLRSAALLCDALVSQWTARQAEIVALMLDRRDTTHENIARLVTPPITQQAVSKALTGAGWMAIEQLLMTFEQNIQTH